MQKNQLKWSKNDILVPPHYSFAFMFPCPFCYPTTAKTKNNGRGNIINLKNGCDVIWERSEEIKHQYWWPGPPRGSWSRPHQEQPTGEKMGRRGGATILFRTLLEYQHTLNWLWPWNTTKKTNINCQRYPEPTLWNNISPRGFSANNYWLLV